MGENVTHCGAVRFVRIWLCEQALWIIHCDRRTGGNGDHIRTCLEKNKPAQSSAAWETAVVLTRTDNMRSIRSISENILNEIKIIEMVQVE